jgi:hypothetical protein
MLVIVRKLVVRIQLAPFVMELPALLRVHPGINDERGNTVQEPVQDKIISPLPVKRKEKINEGIYLAFGFFRVSSFSGRNGRWA